MLIDRGILLLSSFFCAGADFTMKEMEKLPHGNVRCLNIPMIRIETYYSIEDVEQLRTRVEAFIELIKTGDRRKSKWDH